MNISIAQSFNDPGPEDVNTSDYANILIDQMNGLFLLSFLIVADARIAEKCFSKALDEYVEARGGFMEWVKRQGRRAVIRHAIQTVRPTPRPAYSWSLNARAQSRVSAANQPFAAITSLSTFERFVFVITVIEGISEQECAALLNCSIQDVAIGRELAHAIIAVEDLNCDLTGEMDLFHLPTVLGHQQCGIC